MFYRQPWETKGKSEEVMLSSDAPMWCSCAPNAWEPRGPIPSRFMSNQGLESES